MSDVNNGSKKSGSGLLGLLVGAGIGLGLGYWLGSRKKGEAAVNAPDNAKALPDECEPALPIIDVDVEEESEK